MLHMYSGFVWPCHHFCGSIHTMQMLVHVLSMYAVVSTLLKEFNGLSDSVGGILVLGLASALIVAIAQPLFSLPFTLYRIIDNRPYSGVANKAYAAQDLAEFGIRGSDFVGVSEKSMAAIDKIDAFDTLGSTGQSDVPARRAFANTFGSTAEAPAEDEPAAKCDTLAS